jgi:choloylglycine hydrolase
MRKYFCIFISLLFIIVLQQRSDACTIFNKHDASTTLVGNNEDYQYSISSMVWIVPPKDNTYGRVCFANSSYVQGGMNEKGLFYDGASCPTAEVPYFENKPQLGMDFGEIVISKCANVQEAVKMIREINIPSGFNDHIMFTDQSGDSVVAEWVDGKLQVIPIKGEYQLITNFWLTNPKLGWYPCSRYDKAKTILDKKNSISVELFASILKDVVQDWGDGGTKYSNIYDLKTKDVYVFNKGNFERAVKINLIDELKNIKKNEKLMYSVDELFEKKDYIEVLKTETKVLKTEKPVDSASETEIVTNQSLVTTNTSVSKDTFIYKNMVPLVFCLIVIIGFMIYLLI